MVIAPIGYPLDESFPATEEFIGFRIQRKRMLGSKGRGGAGMHLAAQWPGPKAETGIVCRQRWCTQRSRGNQDQIDLSRAAKSIGRLQGIVELLAPKPIKLKSVSTDSWTKSSAKEGNPRLT